MEGVPAENLEALQEINWEARLEKARAQRERILHAKAKGGAGLKDRPTLKPAITPDGIPLDGPTGLAESIARRRRPAPPPVDNKVRPPVPPLVPGLEPAPVNNPAPISTDDALDTPAPVVPAVKQDEDTPDIAPVPPAVVAAPPAPAEPKRKSRAGMVYIAVGFCAGIGVAGASMVFKDSLFSTNSNVTASDEPAVPVPNIETAALPAPTPLATPDTAVAPVAPVTAVAPVVETPPVIVETLLGGATSLPPISTSRDTAPDTESLIAGTDAPLALNTAVNAPEALVAAAIESPADLGVGTQPPLALAPLQGPSVLTEFGGVFAPPEADAAPVAPALSDTTQAGISTGDSETPAINAAPDADALPVHSVTDVVALAPDLAATLNSSSPNLAPVPAAEGSPGPLRLVTTTGSFAGDTAAEGALRAAGLVPDLIVPSAASGEIPRLAPLPIPAHPFVWGSVAPGLAAPNLEASPRFVFPPFAGPERQDLMVLVQAAQADASPSINALPPATLLPPEVNLSAWIFIESEADEKLALTAKHVVEQMGFPVRGVVQVDYRISQNQVRFYDLSSVNAATVLSAMIEATPKDFRDAGLNAPPGVMEVYLAGPMPTIPEPAPADGSQTVEAKPEEDPAAAMRAKLLTKLRGNE